MNSTVTSLLFDSIEWFICKPRPQYLPRMKEKQIFGMIHKVNIMYDVGNRIIIIHQADQTRYYINLKRWLEYYSGERKKKKKKKKTASNKLFKWLKGKNSVFRHHWPYNDSISCETQVFPLKPWQGIKKKIKVFQVGKWLINEPTVNWWYS